MASGLLNRNWIPEDSVHILEVYWERFLELCTQNQPLPQLAAVALLMLLPLYFFRYGTLEPFLEEDKWKSLPLAEKIICNHNTRRFR